MGKRGRGVAGLSLVASAGLLGAYVGYPGLRKAHAVTACEVSSTGDNDTAPYTPGQLRYCLDHVNTNGGGTITFAESTNGTAIKLEDDLPEVTLTSSVTITGNGVSKTILDGDYYSGFYFDGSSAVTVTVTGLTIKDAENRDGAAIQTKNDAPIVVTNSRFEGNNASGGNGGAIRTSGGNVTVSGSTFTNNTATGATSEGGAIRTSAGDVYVTGSTFTSNTAGHEGGAIRTSGGNVTVTNSTLTTNTAGDDGGAIRTSGGDVTVSGSTFGGNTATNGDGGAIRTSGGNVTVTNSTLTTNTAGGDGGAIWDYEGTVSATNSTFTGNSATNKGGAIMVDDYVGNAYLNFVTMSGNTASGGSSGALDFAGIATVKNSIVWGNTGGDVNAGGSLMASNSLFTSTSSVEPPVSGDSLIFGEDPLLGSLANNGGPTQTMMPGAGSPVLGAANPAGAPATDQRGYTRTTNGRADMGAVERLGLPPVADPSQVPPSWHQAQGREQLEASCPPGMDPSWAQWPNEGIGGWTCEYTTWWDASEGVGGGWVTTPGFRSGRIAR